jgi:hypothetical protein
MSHFYDHVCEDVVHKGRVFEVVNKQGDHLWYEINQRTYKQHKLVAEVVCSDFEKGKFLGLSESDMQKALRRVRK